MLLFGHNNISAVLLSREMCLDQVNLCLPDILDTKKTVNQVRPSNMTVEIIFREDFCSP